VQHRRPRPIQPPSKLVQQTNEKALRNERLFCWVEVLTHPRHCERSEAIQQAKSWIASSQVLLAMTDEGEA
jgi:hypothetical protein